MFALPQLDWRGRSYKQLCKDHPNPYADVVSDVVEHQIALKTLRKDNNINGDGEGNDNGNGNGNSSDGSTNSTIGYIYKRVKGKDKDKQKEKDKKAKAQAQKERDKEKEREKKKEKDKEKDKEKEKDKKVKLEEVDLNRTGEEEDGSVDVEMVKFGLHHVDPLFQYMHDGRHEGGFFHEPNELDDPNMHHGDHRYMLQRSLVTGPVRVYIYIYIYIYTYMSYVMNGAYGKKRWTFIAKYLSNHNYHSLLPIYTHHTHIHTYILITYKTHSGPIECNALRKRARPEGDIKRGFPRKTPAPARVSDPVQDTER